MKRKDDDADDRMGPTDIVLKERRTKQNKKKKKSRRCQQQVSKSGKTIVYLILDCSVFCNSEIDGWTK